jgi:hypothetical protein
LVTIDRADVLLLNHTHYGRVRVVTSEASKYPRSVRHSGLFGRIARARKQSSRGLREGGSDVTLGCCRYTSSVQLPPIPRLSPRTLSFCGSSAVNRTLRRRKRRAPETFFRTGLPPSYRTFLVYNNACALGKRQRHSVFMPAVRFSTPSPDQHVTQQQDALTRVSIARGENVRIRGRVVESCRRLPACFLASSLFATSRASGVPACSAVRTP